MLPPTTATIDMHLCPSIMQLRGQPLPRLNMPLPPRAGFFTVFTPSSQAILVVSALLSHPVLTHPGALPGPPPPPLFGRDLRFELRLERCEALPSRIWDSAGARADGAHLVAGAQHHLARAAGAGAAVIPDALVPGCECEFAQRVARSAKRHRANREADCDHSAEVAAECELGGRAGGLQLHHRIRKGRLVVQVPPVDADKNVARPNSVTRVRRPLREHCADGQAGEPGLLLLELEPHRLPERDGVLERR
eukprot:scaffold175_cov150-Isochrysis_galbana.AAC.4